jgi:hypothetical protein
MGLDGGPTVCVSRRPPEGHVARQYSFSIHRRWKIAPTGRSAARIVVPLVAGSPDVDDALPAAAGAAHWHVSLMGRNLGGFSPIGMDVGRSSPIGMDVGRSSPIDINRERFSLRGRHAPLAAVVLLKQESMSSFAGWQEPPASLAGWHEPDRLLAPAQDERNSGRGRGHAPWASLVG